MSVTNLCMLISEALSLEEKNISINSSEKSCSAWDSLGSVLIVMALEKNFKINIPENVVFLSVQEIITYLKNLGININD